MSTDEGNNALASSEMMKTYNALHTQHEALKAQLAELQGQQGIGGDAIKGALGDLYDDEKSVEDNLAAVVSGFQGYRQAESRTKLVGAVAEKLGHDPAIVGAFVSQLQMEGKLDRTPADIDGTASKAAELLGAMPVFKKSDKPAPSVGSHRPSIHSVGSPGAPRTEAKPKPKHPL